jgi:nucleoside-diphosphate-sugar epimerase
MEILFVGGTGLISSACAELVLRRGHGLTLITRSRSKKYPIPRDADLIRADIHTEEADVARRLRDRHFDAVVDWIAFTPEDIDRDIRLFRKRTGQFVFISSASAYQKPPKSYIVTEETPLENPFWDYSQNKIACEKDLMQAYREQGFPVTIIRPSLTYGPSQIPVCMGSWEHPYTIIDRIKRGKQIIIPGDGTSLWVLTWNEDFAIGLVGLLGREETIGEAFQITSDEVLNWNQIYDELISALGLEAKIVHIPSDLIATYWPHAVGSLIGDKANSIIFDNSKIKRYVPEFDCKVGWAEGVRRCLTWFEMDASRQSIDEAANERWDSILAAYLLAFLHSHD